MDKETLLRFQHLEMQSNRAIGAILSIYGALITLQHLTNYPESPIAKNKLEAGIKDLSAKIDDLIAHMDRSP